MFSVGLDALLINADFSSFFYNVDDYSLISLNSINYLNIIPFIRGSTKKVRSYSSEEINQIVFGSILGDGKLELAKRSLNARFGFIQSTKFLRERLISY